MLLQYLENSRYYIPGTSLFEETPSGLVPGYLALIVLSAVASAIGCWLLARRYAFSRARMIELGTRWLLLWLGRVALDGTCCRNGRRASPARIVASSGWSHATGVNTAVVSTHRRHATAPRSSESARCATTPHIDSEIIGRLTLKALILKEWRETSSGCPCPDWRSGSSS